jgi:hypothetical protein
MNKLLLAALTLLAAGAARAADGPAAVACAQPEIRLRGGSYFLTLNGCHYNAADTGRSVYLTSHGCFAGASGELACSTPKDGPRVCRGVGRNAGVELIVGDERSFVLKTAADREAIVYVLPPDSSSRRGE